MHEEELYTYHQFGWNWCLAFSSSPSLSIKSTLSGINWILKSIEQLDLPVSRVAISEDLKSLKKKLEKLDPKIATGKEHAKYLSDLIKNADKTIDSELKSRYAYRLTEKKTRAKKFT